MKRARIMIVEDEAIPAMFLKHMLEKLGHTITATVSSGEEALTKAVIDSPNLVIMDVRLGGDMDGVAAAQAIKNKTGVQSIIVSAYDDSELRQRYGIENDMPCVTKPVSQADLVRAMEKAFAGA